MHITTESIPKKFSIKIKKKTSIVLKHCNEKLRPGARKKRHISNSPRSLRPRNFFFRIFEPFREIFRGRKKIGIFQVGFFFPSRPRREDYANGRPLSGVFLRARVKRTLKFIVVY